MKHDLKNHGQGIKSSAQVTQAQKRHQRIDLAVTALGGLIGALCVIYATTVLFN